MTATELIGWGSAVVLLPTFGVQTYKQWRDRHEPASGSSLWFFVLAFIGTGGQAVYSWLVGNSVYLALNAILVVTNGIGLAIDVYRWKGAPSRRRPATRKEHISARGGTRGTHPGPRRTDPIDENDQDRDRDQGGEGRAN